MSTTGSESPGAGAGAGGDAEDYGDGRSEGESEEEVEKDDDDGSSSDFDPEMVCELSSYRPYKSVLISCYVLVLGTYIRVWDSP